MATYTHFRVAIAGGGTGGHLFPGIAVARELEKRFDKCQVLFVVGKGGRGGQLLRDSGYEPSMLDIEGIKGRGIGRGLAALWMVPKSIMQARALLNSFSPKVILGVGGYCAGPLCIAGKTMGIPTAIHEQNAYPGLTNRLLSRTVDRIFISFEETSALLKGKNHVLTGTPVREEFFLKQTKKDDPEKIFTVLVTGGSQGAKAINEAVTDALSIIKERGKTIGVIHQTGLLDYQETIMRYKRKGLQGHVVDFIKDMAGAYARADLVICRAGASTIFELAAAGKPAILIPYPYAANRHQELNAMAMAKLGGAEVLLQKELDGQTLANFILKYMDDPKKLEYMGTQAKRLASPRAAEIIAKDLMELAGV